jgi:3-deoxy-D-manno-octulosonic-acid transferase
MLKQKKISFVQRSQPDSSPATPPDALLVDTTGELAAFYAAADIVFVGKSLLHHGGQNPIESAMCGKATIVGPHMENFPAVMPPFLKENALLQIQTPAELENAVQSLLTDAAERSRLGDRAAKVVEKNRGAIQRTLQLLQKEAH